MARIYEQSLTHSLIAPDRRNSPSQGLAGDLFGDRAQQKSRVADKGDREFACANLLRQGSTLIGDPLRPERRLPRELPSQKIGEALVRSDPGIEEPLAVAMVARLPGAQRGSIEPRGVLCHGSAHCPDRARLQVRLARVVGRASRRAKQRHANRPRMMGLYSCAQPASVRIRERSCFFAELLHIGEIAHFRRSESNGPNFRFIRTAR
jgi:hypothetical protein